MVPGWVWQLSSTYCQHHGARLEIQSEEGVGSTFTCYFPSKRVLPPANSASISASPAWVATRIEDSDMETADLSHHISRRFNEDLERVRTKVMAMGGFVEAQLAKALTSLIEGDSSLGESVAIDDLKVNGMEITIDEECSRILATRSPAAGDLRVIVAIIKTITDLERIGDEGEKIGYIASRLATMERPENKYREIKHLGRIVSEMVHDCARRLSRAGCRQRIAGGATGSGRRRGVRGHSPPVHHVHDGRPADHPPCAGRHVGRALAGADRRPCQEHL